jgi:hypothetical protein
MCAKLRSCGAEVWHDTKADLSDQRIVSSPSDAIAAGGYRRRHEKLTRLYKLVEDGTTWIDDVLKDRLNALKAERDKAKSALERVKLAGGQPILIDPAPLERFGHNRREHFTSGSIPFRKAYLQSLIDVIEVDGDQIRVNGNRDVLE